MDADRLRPSDAAQVSSLLEAHAGGDRSALDRLIPLVYSDLRRIAHHRLRSERAAHTLDTTAIVHEAYLRLAADEDPSWRNRSHFMAVCSRVIRNLLIDHERRRSADKRGGGRIKIPLREDLAQADDAPGVELLDLDAALTELARVDPRLERVVEYRFFGGLTVAEVAEVLGVSMRTVERDWTRAKAYLYRALAPTDVA